MKIKKVMTLKTVRAVSVPAICLTILVLIWTIAVAAQQNKPLLISGKRCFGGRRNPAPNDEDVGS